MAHCGIHHPMKLHNASGNLAALIAAGLFGASVVATRVAVQEIPPLNLAILRFGQGGLILFLCLFFGARNLLKVKQHDLPFLVLLGAILFAIFPVTFNISLRFTEASRGALMLATMPIWSAWIARVARKERLNPRQIAGILFTFTGVGIVLAERGLNWQGSAFALAGDGLMLLTALCGAIYGVLAQRMLARYSALAVTMYAMLFGTFLLFPAALLEGLPQTFIRIDGKIAILILFLGIFGGALAFYLWTFALTRLTPTLLSEILGSQHVLGGLCGLFCYVADPGHIVHAGTDPFVKFGELDNHRSQRVELLLETFTRAGINTEIPMDIQVAMWMKFLFITVWSGIGAVTRSPVGIWRSLPETRQMAKQGLLEIIAVAKSRNISLPVEALQTAMVMYDGLAPQSTSSLQRDIMDKRPSELEAQIGAVVRFGKESNVTTPQHTFIYQSLLPMELQARGQLQVNE